MFISGRKNANVPELNYQPLIKTQPFPVSCHLAFVTIQKRRGGPLASVTRAEINIRSYETSTIPLFYRYAVTIMQ